jgi:hypothetical protein
MARKSVNPKGRREHGPFIQVSKVVITGPEFAHLSAYGVKLFIDLYGQFNGRNNGDLCASWTLMSDRGWRSKATLHRAIKELRDKGWLVVSRQGGRNKASLYALTWLPVDECGGNLDIAATAAPLGTWRHNGFGTSYVNQVGTSAVPN